MRLWHLLFAVGTVAVAMSLCREPITRVFVIVTVTGIGEIAFGLAAVMALFQTLGAVGDARGLTDHVEAVAATTVVLGVASAVMGGWFFAGAWLVDRLT